MMDPLGYRNSPKPNTVWIPNDTDPQGGASLSLNATTLSGHQFNDTFAVLPKSSMFTWEILILVGIVLTGIVGNVLVCAAIIVEKKLQNITNAFLMSLAIADLLVTILVMPCSIIHQIMGYWPFGLVLCDSWQVADVMLCTSSIMHMCIISIDRYIRIKNPLKTRITSKLKVGLKIGGVWLTSFLISSPIIILGVYRPQDLLTRDNQCGIFNRYFVIYGSLAAFFIPLLLMLATYSMTIHILKKKVNENREQGAGLRRTKASKESVQQHKKITFQAKMSANVGNISRKVKRMGVTSAEECEPLNSVSRGSECKKNKTVYTSGCLDQSQPEGSSTCTVHHRRHKDPHCQPQKRRTSVVLKTIINHLNEVRRGTKGGDVHCIAERNEECPSCELDETSIVTNSSEQLHKGQTSKRKSNGQLHLVHMGNTRWEESTFDDMEIVAVHEKEPDARKGGDSPVNQHFGSIVKSTSSGEKHDHSLETAVLTARINDDNTSFVSENSAHKSYVHGYTDTPPHASATNSYDSVVPRIIVNGEEICSEENLVAMSAVGDKKRNSCPGPKHGSNDNSWSRLNHPDTSDNEQMQSLWKSAWSRLSQPNVHATGQTPTGELAKEKETTAVEQPKEQPQSTPKFQALVKKHSAAFRVAAILTQRRENVRKKEMRKVKTEQKAVKVLGTMFAIFFICWAPFFTLNLAIGICYDTCNVQSVVFFFFLWLGYVSSILNPIIYTIFNKTFKNTFIKLLSCKMCKKPSTSSSYAIVTAGTKLAMMGAKHS